ncbi:MAG: HAD-IA family hydrolase [Candidatus Latescibacterota bacterium]|nr:MAG: HAD-IA family hydrolase [Candidatus Latescibacterota bacterium]
MTFKAVMFDLDGTLLDTLEDIADSANRVLKRHGYPTRSNDDYRYFVGDGVRMLVRRLLPVDARSDNVIESMHDEFREEYGRNWKTKTKPYDGVPEMLDGLVARQLRLAVLSNKPDDFTKQCVEELLPAWTFDIVMGYHDRLPPKPDPAGALQIADRLGIKPGEFLYLGDTSIDMKTATAAGMKPVGVLWGIRGFDELKGSGARSIIEKPGDVFTLL